MHPQDTRTHIDIHTKINHLLILLKRQQLLPTDKTTRSKPPCLHVIYQQEVRRSYRTLKALAFKPTADEELKGFVTKPETQFRGVEQLFRGNNNLFKIINDLILFLCERGPDILFETKAGTPRRLLTECWSVFVQFTRSDKGNLSSTKHILRHR